MKAKQDPVSLDQFQGLLVAHGLIDECAIYDPEDFDNYRTYNQTCSAHRELIETLSRHHGLDPSK